MNIKELELEALLYDWHNDLVLSQQNSDIGYYSKYLLNHIGLNVLIVGAGTGRVAIPLNELSRITALDISEARLDILKSKGPNIETINQDITKFITRKKYNLVISPYSTFQGIGRNKLSSALEKVYEALEPNGYFIFDVSGSFNSRKNTNWIKVTKGDFMGDSIVEYNKTKRGQNSVTIQKKFVKENDAKVILKITEEWDYCDKDFLEELIKQNNFKIMKIDQGYSENQSSHRFIYHCQK